MVRNAPELVRVPTQLPPLTRELWLLFHRDVGRTPAVRAVIDHIIAIMTQAKAAFLAKTAAGRGELIADRPTTGSATAPVVRRPDRP